MFSKEKLTFFLLVIRKFVSYYSGELTIKISGKIVIRECLSEISVFITMKIIKLVVTTKTVSHSYAGIRNKFSISGSGGFKRVTKASNQCLLNQVVAYICVYTVYARVDSAIVALKPAKFLSV